VIEITIKSFHRKHSRDRYVINNVKVSIIKVNPQCPNCAKRKRRATHTRITFKSNDRFGGFQVVIEQPEGI
jgi:hypothetical protein